MEVTIIKESHTEQNIHRCYDYLVTLYKKEEVLKGAYQQNAKNIR
ncbi:MAG: hypothetical protein WAM95_22255 [Bacillus sp. (in: firmicutes)]